ncbi:MAG: tRNA (N(6)-L-threonylcarbamoyladenosine(37)-C(2))-methylthiotransferase MtaB [Thermoguttaceae bacterium]
MPLLRTITLGCKVNQYETELVAEGLARVGFREAAEGESADLCLVNTCTVTAEGALKSRKAIRQLAKGNPGTQIVVMGCYATMAEKVVAELPGVSEVLTDKRQIPEFLARWGVLDAPRGISRFGHRSRAYVKVQDGCRMRCSYCIIPAARGDLASRPVDDLVLELRRLVDAGHREIVLTGIHLGHWGMEWTDRRLRLADLVEELLHIEGHWRLRLSSLEAVEVDRRLLSLMAAHTERICPHLHLSMQSGSDSVLERMQRRWAAGRFVEKCLEVKERLDMPALTTDVIVGFPGETESEFAATCRVVEMVGFSKVHVFRFSPREGTPAASMPGQVDGRVKQERAAELDALASGLRQRYFAALVGRPMQVLVESAVADRPGVLEGTSSRYAPVELTGTMSQVGRLVDAEATGLSADGLSARLL